MILLNESITKFIHYCKYEKILDTKSIKAYMIDLRQFAEFVSINYDANIKVCDIDKHIIRDYLKYLSESYKVKTIKRKVATLKAFFSFLELEEYILVTPFKKIKLRLKEPFILPKTLTIDEIELILRSAYDQVNSIEDRNTYTYKASIRDLAILELLFATGVRVSELCNLSMMDVDLDAKYITINGKNNKQRLIYLSSESTLLLLSKYYDLFDLDNIKTKYFFINRLSSRLSEQSVRNIVKKHSSMIKKNVTPHVFRHTFATLLLEEGVDILYIQKLLGHHSIVVTQIYTYASKAKQKEVLAESHPRKDIIGLKLNEG